MKDYERLTDDWFDCNKCINGKCEEPNIFCQDRWKCERHNRLAELEDKIESGELCDREEVRKETAKEILQELLFSVENCKKKDILWYIESISKRYGVELFGKTEQVENFDKLEDEV